MSASHLFPKLLGTKFFTRTTCTPCNSFLGHAVEANLLEKVFVTAALAKLGLKNKAEAYGKGRTVDTETGFEMRFRPDGMVEPITKALGNSGFVGTPESIAEAMIKWFKKQYPNWPTKPLEDFYNDPGKQSFNYVGRKFTKKIIPGKLTTLAVKKPGQVPASVIFKIAYEWLCLSSVILLPPVNRLMQDMFCIQKSEGKTGDSIHEIQFSSEIERRTIRYGEVPADDKPNLEKLPYSPECYVMNRRTKEGVVFVHVSLFQYLNYFLVLDKVEVDSIPAGGLNNALFVSAGKGSFGFLELDESQFQATINEESNLVDAWYKML